MESLTTTQLEFRRTIGVRDTYITGTVPELLCKRAAKAHESDDLGEAFVLTLDAQAPALEEVAAVQVEVDSDALGLTVGVVELS
jgi:hypothetical protein